MELLLASKSPRRKHLLSQLGLPLQVVAIEVDETVEKGIPVNEIAERIALRKADGFPTQELKEHQILVTADTIVALEHTVMGKPKTPEEAIQMLEALSGKRHTVYTGVCLTSASKRISFTEATFVHFKDLEASEILHYVEHYKPYDKAGAYGIQEWIGMIGIESIEGCYYNVMGLPVARMHSALKEFHASN